MYQKLSAYRKVYTILIILIAMRVSASLAQDQSDKSKIIGTWQGSLKVPGVELRIVFNISQPAEDSLTATMDSPDQGAFGIPVSKVTFKNDSLKALVKGIGGLFEGKVADNFSRIDGHWKQSGMSFLLALKRVDEAPKINRPQEPQKPYPYIEEEVIYQNEKAGIQLAGTLTLPRSDKTCPAVLLITGSGAQDRNETIFAHRPFLILADYLTRRGIAVLRVDDRGVGGSTGNMSQSTTEDFASDVLAGINYLKNGTSDSAIMKNQKSQKQLFAIIKQEKDDSVAVLKLRSVLKEIINKLSDAEKKEMGNGETYINVQLKQFTSPWFRYFLTYDPRPTLMKVKCPVLAINGELDLQVPPKDNLLAIEGALKAGGNKNYTIKEFPKLNHLFQTAETGSPNEYGKIEETMSPAVLKFIGDWILQVVAI